MVDAFKSNYISDALPLAQLTATHTSTGFPRLPNLPMQDIFDMGVRSAASSGMPTTRRQRVGVRVRLEDGNRESGGGVLRVCGLAIWK